MATERIPLRQRIEFLEAALELERIRWLSYTSGLGAQRVEREKSAAHCDYLLDELANLYLERAMTPPPAAI